MMTPTPLTTKVMLIVKLEQILKVRLMVAAIHDPMIRVMEMRGKMSDYPEGIRIAGCHKEIKYQGVLEHIQEAMLIQKTCRFEIGISTG